MALVITADENLSPWETFSHERVTPHVGKLQHNSEAFWTENDLTRYIAKSNIEIWQENLGVTKEVCDMEQYVIVLFAANPALVLSQTRTLIDRLQKLVSSDGRFKNMREALRWYVDRNDLLTFLNLNKIKVVYSRRWKEAKTYNRYKARENSPKPTHNLVRLCTCLACCDWLKI